MHKASLKLRKPFLAFGLASLAAAWSPAFAGDFTVKSVSIEDKKAVFATVESTDSISARVRTSGTVTKLSVTEGDEVSQGQVIAVVRDPKLDLQIDAIDAQIRAAEREIANIKTELERTQALFDRGSSTKAALDQVNTRYDVAQSQLEASQAQKAVIVRQMVEGDVLAPQSGRVLDVPITVGSVVMTGEAVATIAKDNYILRLALPERHARFLATGDTVEIAGRTGDCVEDCNVKGKINKVYPQISDGRVLADATVPELGDYFVGERIQVRIGVGERDTYLVPKDFVFTRYGIDFVKAEGADGAPTEIAVQVGLTHAAGELTGTTDGPMIEILSGLKAGDELLRP